MRMVSMIWLDSIIAGAHLLLKSHYQNARKAAVRRSLKNAQIQGAQNPEE